MRLHDQFRECVGFLRLKQDAPADAIDPTPVATAFFVSMPLAEDLSQPYLVTAAHVVQQARARDEALTVRINRQRGWEDLAIQTDEWMAHARSDVAVAPVDLEPDSDVIPIPSRILADESFLRRLDVGEGDEVFVTGLFSAFVGETKDQPIVRFGNIALGNHEPLSLKMPSGRAEMEGYLIEARSSGGHSGSPVFVYFMGSRDGFGPGESLPHAHLLGLVHGHYELDAKVEFRHYDDHATAPFNAGIAAVMPAPKIMELLMEDKLVKAREEELRRLPR